MGGESQPPIYHCTYDRGQRLLWCGPTLDRLWNMPGEIEQRVQHSASNGTLLREAVALWRSERSGRAMVIDAVARVLDSDTSYLSQFESAGLLQGFERYAAHLVWKQVLPKLTMSPLDVIPVAVRMLERSEDGGCRGEVCQGFAEYCAADGERCNVVLSAIESDWNGRELLPFVLEAGAKHDLDSYVAHVRRLCDEGEDIASLALRGLSLFAWREDADPPQPSLDIVSEVLNEDDDQGRGWAITTLGRMLEARPGLAQRAGALLEAAEIVGENTVHACSRLWAIHPTPLPPEVFGPIESAVAGFDPRLRGTASIIDIALERELSSDAPERGLEVLDRILGFSDSFSFVELFPDVVALIRRDRQLRATVLTRWLVGGRIRVCANIESLVAAGRGGMTLEADQNVCRSADADLLLKIAQRAVGYLFYFPVAASSYLVSLMRLAADERVRTGIAQLLLNPVLMNYPGSVREYLEGLEESEPIASTIGAELDKITGYLCDLRDEPLPELLVSDSWWVASRHRLDRISEKSIRDAESRSQLLSLVSKVPLLYGRGWLGPEEEVPGDRRLLQEVDATIEVPRMARFDQVGLELLLFRLKTDGMA